MTSITATPSKNWFSEKELQCRCSVCQHNRKAGEAIGFNADQIDVGFLQHLNRLREFWYCQPMAVSSGFRCVAHPREQAKRLAAEERGTPFIPGDHPCGLAVDVQVSGAPALALMEAAAAYNWAHLQAGLPRPFTAISLHQRGQWAGRFVHLGGNTEAPGRPRPTTWTY